MITSPLPPLDPPQEDPSPDTPHATHDTTNLSLEIQHPSCPKDDDETESEHEPQLSRSPSTVPSTSDAPLRTPADDYVSEGRQWMSSAAREEEVKEWGQYLGEAKAADRRLSAFTGFTASSSSAWGSLEFHG